MDQLFWKAKWQETSDEELFQKIREVTSQKGWVLDGNYTRTIPDKWKRVQLVIWLDLSFVRTVFRVTKRTIRRSLSRQEIWPGTGNRESLAKAFLSKESIILWAITSYRRNRKNYRDAMASTENSHIHFIRLKSPKSVASFLERLRRVAEQASAYR